jgi:eukaryotic-like serine/threonine-protein kinase
MTASPPPRVPDPGEKPPSIDLSGRTLGEFQFIRRLGKGGMADVYLALQTTLQRHVAVKVLRHDLVADPTYVKRFRHEAAAAGGLNHPNIVQVYSIGEQDGVYFISQEYVAGGNLREFMKRNGPLEVPMALKVLRQVASALQVAGDAGIVHRDIKPENILLTKKGDAKVADFGLAQLTQQGERLNLTQVGVTMGTPLYMSPEQVSGKPLDQRSDIYSVGAMCYHMLAGRPPFQGETALAIAVQHLNVAPARLNERRVDLPIELCDLIHRMMSKSREDRPADAATLLNQVKALARKLTGKDSQTETLKRVRQRRFKTLDLPARRQLQRFALCALAALLCGAAWGWSTRIGDPLKTTPPAGKTVEQLSSIEAQFLAATLAGDDEASWRAVVDYPPDAAGRRDEMVRQTAEVRLAIVLMQNQRLDEADEIRRRLHAEGAANPWKSEHAILLEVVLLSLRGDFAGSRSVLNTFENKLKGSKLDQRLLELVAETRERNQQHLSGSSKS